MHGMVTATFHYNPWLQTEGLPSPKPMRGLIDSLPLIRTPDDL
jgi:hypothetical protein